MPPRKKAPARNPQAVRHVNDLALKVSRAMSHDFVVTVKVSGRLRQRVVGRIVARRVREGWKPTGSDGETGLEFDIVGEHGRETIRLDRVVSIERQRIAPPA